MAKTSKKCGCGEDLHLIDAEVADLVKDLVTFGGKTFLRCWRCGARHQVFGAPPEFCK